MKKIDILYSSYLFAFCTISAFFLSCTATKQIERKEEITDSAAERVNKYEQAEHNEKRERVAIYRDSVYIKDSVYFTGAQQVKERIVYRFLWRHDTIRIQERENSSKESIKEAFIRHTQLTQEKTKKNGSPLLSIFTSILPIWTRGILLIILIFLGVIIYQMGKRKW